MNQPIGIFDSGIGGVTVLKEIIKVLPKEEYIFFSDSANNPYGDKDKEKIIKICDNIVEELLKHNCKAIVIACNTASAVASKYLREKYDIPIIAIEPAYKMVYDRAYDSVTLVMATEGTIKSEKFNLLYEKYNNNKTYLIPCVGLADAIESANSKRIEAYLNEHLKQYKGRVKNVVLGCTHYPLIKDEIKKILGDDIQFFDGAKGLATHLKDVLKQKDLLNKGKTRENNIVFFDTNEDRENSKLKEERFFKYLKY